MKKIYMKPELEVISTKTERLLTTDSTGWIGEDEIGAKETSGDMFDQTDDLWEYDTKKDIWG